MDRGNTTATPRILGLTGPIACGKSTVGDILLELGALERIDADQVVHDLQRSGTETTAAIAAAFGDVLDVSGAVDRRRLAREVFADPEALKMLEAIVHPAVRQEIRRRLDTLRGQAGVVVVDAVKLLQSDLLPLVETVWVVRCGRDEQRRRLTDIRRLSPDDACSRVAAQPLFEHPRVSAAIENSGSLADLRARVTALWEALHRPSDPASPGTDQA